MPGNPARSGWLTRWFGAAGRHSALPTRRPSPRSSGARFTPEAYPGFSPDVCEFLNTPVEECDPDLLQLVLAMLARHIAENLPPELGLNAEALFSTLWGRLGAVPGAAGPAAPPAEEPPPVPAMARNAEPDAPPAAPPILPPLPGTGVPDDAATVPIAARNFMPDAASRIAFAWLRNRSRWRARHSLRHCRHAGFRRGPPDALHCLPPRRRLCYAACAGPP